MPDENKRINPETGQPYPSNKEKLDDIEVASAADITAAIAALTLS